MTSQQERHQTAANAVERRALLRELAMAKAGTPALTIAAYRAAATAVAEATRRLSDTDSLTSLRLTAKRLKGDKP